MGQLLPPKVRQNQLPDHLDRIRLINTVWCPEFDPTRAPSRRQFDLTDQIIGIASKGEFVEQVIRHRIGKIVDRSIAIGIGHAVEPAAILDRGIERRDDRNVRRNLAPRQASRYLAIGIDHSDTTEAQSDRPSRPARLRRSGVDERPQMLYDQRVG